MLYWQQFMIAALLSIPSLWLEAVLIRDSFDLEFELL